MKYQIFLWMCLLGFLAACEDDNGNGFDVPVEFRKTLRFDPVPGGAMMRYYLPDNADIFNVRVTYTNAWGEQALKEGSYLADSLLIDGFTEACTAKANVTFFNRQMEESAPLEVSFQTQADVTVSIFDDLKVESFWGGFKVSYSAPEKVSGMLHIFYLGTNPFTQQPDSILMRSRPIKENGDTINIEMAQDMESIHVIVRTDNYKGKRVKLAGFPDRPALRMDTLGPDDFDFRFTGDIVEDADMMLGTEYLFDGDKKGLGRRRHVADGAQFEKYSTFVAGPYAFGRRFIVDFRQPKVPASVNLYAFLNFYSEYPSQKKHPKGGRIWSEYYPSRLPSTVKVYGTNDDPETVDLDACTVLHSFEDDCDFYSGFRYSWAQYTDLYYGGKGDNFLKKTDDEIAKADPVVLRMLCNYDDGAAYRYLIFVVEDTYDSSRYYGSEENPYGYVTFNELEICVKAE